MASNRNNRAIHEGMSLREVEKATEELDSFFVSDDDQADILVQQLSITEMDFGEWEVMQLKLRIAWKIIIKAQAFLSYGKGAKQIFRMFVQSASLVIQNVGEELIVESAFFLLNALVTSSTCVGLSTLHQPSSKIIGDFEYATITYVESIASIFKGRWINLSKEENIRWGLQLLRNVINRLNTSRFNLMSQVAGPMVESIRSVLKSDMSYEKKLHFFLHVSFDLGAFSKENVIIDVAKPRVSKAYVEFFSVFFNLVSSETGGCIPSHIALGCLTSVYNIFATAQPETKHMLSAMEEVSGIGMSTVKWALWGGIAQVFLHVNYRKRVSDFTAEELSLVHMLMQHAVDFRVNYSKLPEAFALKVIRIADYLLLETKFHLRVIDYVVESPFACSYPDCASDNCTFQLPPLWVWNVPRPMPRINNSEMEVIDLDDEEEEPYTIASLVPEAVLPAVLPESFMAIPSTSRLLRSPVNSLSQALPEIEEDLGRSDNEDIDFDDTSVDEDSDEEIVASTAISHSESVSLTKEGPPLIVNDGIQSNSTFPTEAAFRNVETSQSQDEEQGKDVSVGGIIHLVEGTTEKSMSLEKLRVNNETDTPGKMNCQLQHLQLNPATDHSGEAVLCGVETHQQVDQESPIIEETLSLPRVEISPNGNVNEVNDGRDINIELNHNSEDVSIEAEKVDGSNRESIESPNIVLFNFKTGGIDVPIAKSIVMEVENRQEKIVVSANNNCQTKNISENKAFEKSAPPMVGNNCQLNDVLNGSASQQEDDESGIYSCSSVVELWHSSLPSNIGKAGTDSGPPPLSPENIPTVVDKEQSTSQINNHLVQFASEDTNVAVQSLVALSMPVLSPIEGCSNVADRSNRSAVALSKEKAAMKSVIECDGDDSRESLMAPPILTCELPYEHVRQRVHRVNPQLFNRSQFSEVVTQKSTPDLCEILRYVMKKTVFDTDNTADDIPNNGFVECPVGKSKSEISKGSDAAVLNSVSSINGSPSPRQNVPPKQKRVIKNLHIDMNFSLPKDGEERVKSKPVFSDHEEIRREEDEKFTRSPRARRKLIGHRGTTITATASGSKTMLPSIGICEAQNEVLEEVNKCAASLLNLRKQNGNDSGGTASCFTPTASSSKCVKAVKRSSTDRSIPKLGPSPPKIQKLTPVLPMNSSLGLETTEIAPKRKRGRPRKYQRPDAEVQEDSSDEDIPIGILARRVISTAAHSANERLTSGSQNDGESRRRGWKSLPLAQSTPNDSLMSTSSGKPASQSSLQPPLSNLTKPILRVTALQNGDKSSDVVEAQPVIKPKKSISDGESRRLRERQKSLALAPNDELPSTSSGQTSSQSSLQSPLPNRPKPILRVSAYPSGNKPSDVEAQPIVRPKRSQSEGDSGRLRERQKSLPLAPNNELPSTSSGQSSLQSPLPNLPKPIQRVSAYPSGDKSSDNVDAQPVIRQRKSQNDGEGRRLRERPKSLPPTPSAPNNVPSTSSDQSSSQSSLQLPLPNRPKTILRISAYPTDESNSTEPVIRPPVSRKSVTFRDRRQLQPFEDILPASFVVMKRIEDEK